MQLVGQKRIQNYAAMYINVKNFKLVNKAYGFQTGTKIMACFAQSSLKYLEKDERFARLGGDNYVALIKKRHLPVFLEQMKNVPVSTTIDGKHIDYHFAVRAGIYLLNEDIHIVSEIMNGTSRAVALTRKESASDYVYYDESVENTMMHNSELEVAMESAMENESFLVYFQPKVSTKEKKLVGAEALVRWDYFGKVLSPFEFIPIFEQTGFIMKVDFYVLNRVCHALRTWMDQGVEPVPISVNFSRAHLSSPDLAERIRAVIRSYNIPTTLVEIEFTETAYINESENLSRTISGLKEAGIAVSMDDFGTGYSSLCLLQDLMFDVLKIDKSLIGNMENSRKAIVLEHIIAMAKELKMYVVCEGVESVENLKFLENTTCDMIQGYLFDRPLPQADFEQRLAHKQYPEM